MTRQEIDLVQSSLIRILPVRAVAARIFYARLFEAAPDTRAMFEGDMVVQGAKLFAALELIVVSLDRLDAVLPAIDMLARRHRDFGVVERHYHAVGAALIWTLEQALGGEFTPELRRAWLTAYGVLSTRMTEAAALPRAA